MSIDREAIHVALFNLLKTNLAASFTTVGRRHLSGNDLSPGIQPALFVCGVAEKRDPRPQDTGGKLTLLMMLFVYCMGPGTNEAPGAETVLAATTMNGLLKAIDDALDPGPGARLTLGGIVQHCWIEGDTPIDPGIFGNQAAAQVPVYILVP